MGSLANTSPKGFPFEGRQEALSGLVLWCKLVEHFPVSGVACWSLGSELGLDFLHLKGAFKEHRACLVSGLWAALSASFLYLSPKSHHGALGSTPRGCLPTGVALAVGATLAWARGLPPIL